MSLFRFATFTLSVLAHPAITLQYTMHDHVPGNAMHYALRREADTVVDWSVPFDYTMVDVDGWAVNRDRELDNDHCHGQGYLHERFRLFPQDGNIPARAVCVCLLGWTGPDCSIPTEDYGPFSLCVEDDDCEDGLLCGPSWVRRGGVIELRCGCPYNYNNTLAKVEHPACAGSDLPDYSSGIIPGYRAIKCKYAGCGDGFQCATLTDELEDFGFCLCAPNSTAPACTCDRRVQDPNNSDLYIQCGSSPEDASNCMSYWSGACDILAKGVSLSTTLATGRGYYGWWGRRSNRASGYTLLSIWR